MQRLIPALIFLLLAGPVRVAAAGDTAPLRSYLESLSTFAADFEQRRFDERGELLEVTSGDALVARPGRFRWTYREPWQQVIVSDGVTLWIHDVDLEQITVTPVGDTPPDSPAALLGQDVDLDAVYAMSVIDGDDEFGLDWYRLAPRAARSDFSSIAVGLGDGEVRAMRLYDNLGQLTAIRFDNVARNQPLDGAAFTFEPPPGVDVIRGGAP